MKFLGIFLKTVCAIVVLSSLIACGGGGEEANDEAPVANLAAIPDQPVLTDINLDASASQDPEGDSLQYKWRFLSLPAGSLASLPLATTTPMVSFVPNRIGIYRIELIVSDGARDSDPFIRTVNIFNSKPQASFIGPSQIVLNDPFTLNANTSSDNDGHALTYQWSIISQPPGSNLVVNETVPEVSPQFDTAGTFEFQLIVTDSVEPSDPVNLTVTVLGQPLNDTVPGQQLNDTIQTSCFDNVGTESQCPLANYPGQDGDSGRDVTNNNNDDGVAGFSFTKLDTNGNSLPNSATSWTCVRDNVTGLVWEVKAALPGNLHSADNTYSWYSLNTRRNSGVAGTLDGGTCTGSRCDTAGFALAVNAANYCGRSNWRMPERTELNSIYRKVNNIAESRVDTEFFPYHGTINYWTGTSPAWSNTIGINGGSANYVVAYGYGFLPKANTFHVKLVSGRKANYPGNVTAANGQTCQTDTVPASTPISRFIDNTNGTLTDKETGLTWLRCPLGRTWDQASNSCTGAGTMYTWQAALQAVASINAGSGIVGFSDWRVPNQKELMSIAEIQCVSPAVNFEVFPIYNTNNLYAFWSSTSTSFSSSDNALGINFRSSGSLISLNKTQSIQVMLVRGQ